MITLKTGSVGEGKSATCISRALDHLRSGGVVATNFGLSKGWAEHATRFSLVDLLDKSARAKRARDLWGRWFRIGTVETILELSEKLPDLVQGEQKKRVKAYRRSGRPGRPESLGLLILDEGHIFFNSRDWRNNMPMIHFLSQSRKKGWDVLIIAHHADMIDSQIRSGLINIEESTRNLAKVKPLPMLPFKFGWLTAGRPMFLGIAKYAGKGGGSGMVHNRSITILTKDIANVYETMEEFNHLIVPEELERIGPAPVLREEVRSIPKKIPALSQAMKEIGQQLS